MKNILLKYIALIFFIGIFIFPFFTLAQNTNICSPKGYTVLTINGVFTNEAGALENKDNLKDRLKNIFNNQPLIVDFLYNPSHIAGLGDFFAVAYQKLFDTETVKDYDLAKMLNDASQRVKTQKLLLVAHSQGNFYANSFYDVVADKMGGVPSQSIGVYSVASPASRVAGYGKYMTSSTDSVIENLRWKSVLYIMPANEDIKLPEGSTSNGHSFSDIYLEYRGSKIVSDIKSSLDKLKENDEQELQEPCISSLELSTLHKIQGVVLAIADPTAVAVKTGLVVSYNVGVYVRDSASNAGMAIGNFLNKTSMAIGKNLKGLTANVVGSLPDTNSVTTIIPDISEPRKDGPSPKTVPATDTQATLVVKTVLALSKTENTKMAENISPPVIPQVVSYGGGGYSGGGTGASLPTLSDIIPPIISIVGASSVNIIKDIVYIDAGATATDDVDGDITTKIIMVNPVDITTLGIYLVTYNVSDAHNNIAIQVIRTVNVVAPPPSPPPPVLKTITIDEDTTLSAGEYNYDNLIITNNAILTLEGDPESPNAFKGVKINAVNLTITEGASISANGKGHGPHQGPGSSLEYGTGASYGGISYSGTTYSTTYGSATMPMNLGSGGVTHGGGAIYLAISDIFTNNGVVSSDGNISSSGGSVYVTTKNMTGSGILRANGGSLYALGYFKSPGGGGRIALYYKTSSFNGITEAKGGCGQYDGMTMSCATDGTVGIFDGSTNDIYVNNTSWKFLQDDTPFSFNQIFILNGAKVTSENGVNITAKNILVDKNSSFTLSDSQILNIPTIVIDGGSTLTLSGSETINANVLTVKGNGIVTVVPEKILSLTIPNINVENGSSISANGKGHGPHQGPGSSLEYGTGASYGGMSYGNSAMPTYGSETEPVNFGSGGATFGGGAIRIIASDTFTNNGVVSSDGNISSSGGSVYVTTKNMTGSGILRANGGGLMFGSYYKSPGGGGRIALYYKTSSFNGITEAKGGCGSYSYPVMSCGQDGTVHIVDESIPVKSFLKIITAFSFKSLIPEVVGVVNETDKTITLSVPFGTDVKTLVPTIIISDKASIFPDNNTAQNFTSSVVYTVIAENSLTQNYVVTVVVLPLPLDTTPPTMVSAVVTSATTIDVTFSEDIDGGTLNTSGNEFMVLGHIVSSAHELNGIITLTLETDIKRGENPSVTFSSTNFKDLAGNQAISPAGVTSTNNL
ncbi:MAG: immunoglobulin-like domain-containing protein [Candidatus Paceibacterota bacterium]